MLEGFLSLRVFADNIKSKLHPTPNCSVCYIKYATNEEAIWRAEKGQRTQSRNWADHILSNRVVCVPPIRK